MEKVQLKVFSERLTKLRQKKELTQQQLGEALQIPRVSITRYETAERTPTVDHLVQFAQFFNVPSDYLLGLSSVESYDTELQAVCDYTGLCAEAVKSLHDYLVYTIEYRKEDFNSFEQYEEYKKIILTRTSLMADIANDYIANDYFYYFLESIIDIEQNSVEWVEACKEGVRHNGPKFYSNEKTEKLSKECDFATLECNRLLDMFIQKHDNRYKNQKPMLFWEHFVLDDIKKEVLAEMEAEQNGKHNPTEE